MVYRVVFYLKKEFSICYTTVPIKDVEQSLKREHDTEDIRVVSIEQQDSNYSVLI